ncbi:thaumatin-like protein 1b [Malania oleifera]|uniref:thaumatin-like protein 1b n=1 Tax=Malania oleifera TaxID=397392 RepID=UPI0025AE57D2|nr:thaumatin-like protein 1b [Malania oleifera]XP_057965972.1 thaumatin-like protein 1b [Malania oleifera]
MDRGFISAAVLILLSLHFFPEVRSASFRIVNKCRYTIWPGLLSGAGTAQLPTTGFVLKSGKAKTITIPKSWSGRIWGRTHCGRDSSRKFSCGTGDCGSGHQECAGAGAKPPATLAEFTLNGAGGLDFYDVSLVDGYNVPMLVVAKGGAGGGCSATGCLVDLNGVCPRELKVALANGTAGVACMSACEAFGDPRFCCSEGYSTPDTCQPSAYSQFFKHACPRAYSYAYDDKTSTFTCASADYIIIFCPKPFTSQKLLGARRKAAELPLVNKTMMYIARRHASSGSSSADLVPLQFVVCAISVGAAILHSWQLS